ncbi:MAG: hypothetical protein ABIR30_08320 [Chitinophagaceae bacterium]
MSRLRSFPLFIAVITLFPSCEFSCSIGQKDEIKGTAEVKDGTRLYNGINLETNGVRVDKAYLLLGDGKRVSDDNFVDFKQTVRLQLIIDSGWVEQEGKVLLGAAEKITAENGTTVLQEDDLFQNYPSGITATDARSIYLSATLKLKENTSPTSFTVSFHVWDKRGAGWIKGSYKLYSK